MNKYETLKERLRAHNTLGWSTITWHALNQMISDIDAMPDDDEVRQPAFAPCAKCASVESSVLTKCTCGEGDSSPNAECLQAREESK